ncbi:murein hydrolase activator EnvC family protein [Nannocystaceae bacterium ST9]
MRTTRVIFPMLALLGLGFGLAGESRAGNHKTSKRRAAQIETREKLRAAAERELDLTVSATELERAEVGLERERESLSWAAKLLERRSGESLRQLDVYRGERVERQQLAEVRARKLYKLSRGGMLEQVFETGADGRSTPAERIARGRTLRFLIDHDLDALRVHVEAETRARAELLAASRELSALAALEGVAALQTRAIAASDAQLHPTLAAVHDDRKHLQAELGKDARAEERRLLRTLAAERRELVRHKGLDLLEPGALERPVRGAVVGEFGDYRDRVLDVPMHRNGVELAAKPNDKVLALAPGRVAFVGALPGFERVVVIEHGGGYLSLTARLLGVSVEEGQELEAGALIGRAGPKAIDDGLGTTVYVELRHGQRPIDPEPWLEKLPRSRKR